MKNFANYFTLLGYLLLATVPIIAQQIPQGISYQAIMRDGNQPLADWFIIVRFTLLQDGIQTYQEEQLTNTNEYGLFNLVIGEGSPVGSSSVFSAINWSYGPAELRVEIDYDQTGFTDFGTLKINSVAYSQASKEAYGLRGVSIRELSDVSNSSPSNGQILKFSGSRWAPSNLATFSSPWSQNSTGLWYNGNVGIGRQPTWRTLVVEDDFGVYDNGKLRVSMNALQTIGGEISTYGSNGNANLRVGGVNQGSLTLNDQFGRSQVRLNTVNDFGSIWLKSNNGTNGFVALGGINNAQFSLSDANGNPQIGGYIVGTTGIIWADNKNFRIIHPTKPDSSIWYCSLEGPEAAEYVRGIARLENGKAFISFKEHFQLTSIAETLTIHLTPGSVDSKGLAVVEKTPQGFWVQERNGGKGTYEFYWLALAVREGHINYRPVRGRYEGIMSPEEMRALESSKEE